MTPYIKSEKYIKLVWFPQFKFKKSSKYSIINFIIEQFIWKILTVSLLEFKPLRLKANTLIAVLNNNWLCCYIFLNLLSDKCFPNASMVTYHKCLVYWNLGNKYQTQDWEDDPRQIIANITEKYGQVQCLKKLHQFYETHPNSAPISKN